MLNAVENRETKGIKKIEYISFAFLILIMIFLGIVYGLANTFTIFLLGFAALSIIYLLVIKLLDNNKAVNRFLKINMTLGIIWSIYYITDYFIYLTEESNVIEATISFLGYILLIATVGTVSYFIIKIIFCFDNKIRKKAANFIKDKNYELKDIFGTYFFILFIEVYCFSFFKGLAFGILGESFDETLIFYISDCFLSNTILIILALFFIFHRHRMTKESIIGNKKRIAGNIFKGIILWLPLFFISSSASRFNYGIMSIIDALPEYIPSSIDGYLESSKHILEWIIPILGISVMVPIAEELFYRGFLYNGLKKRFGIQTAILISGLLFAYVHFNLAYRFFPMTIVGIFFAYIYEKNGSIVTTIALHSLHNFIVTII